MAGAPSKFPSRAQYTPPGRVELNRRMVARGAPELVDLADPDADIDNRDAVRMWLLIRGIEGNRWARLVEPYDLGYHYVSDGKSHPVPRWRIPARFRRSKLNKDPAAVRHDLEYYLQEKTRRVADQNYLHDQISCGMPRVLAATEFSFLRAFGWCAWNTHARRARRDAKSGRVPAYGSRARIPELIQQTRNPCRDPGAIVPRC